MSARVKHLGGALLGAFLGIGSVGGWWYFGDRFIPTAHAQSSTSGGSCGPGKVCTSTSFTASQSSGSCALTTTEGAYICGKGNANGALRYSTGWIVYSSDNAIDPSTDNNINFGSAALRWKSVRAGTTGVISSGPLRADSLVSNTAVSLDIVGGAAPSGTTKTVRIGSNGTLVTGDDVAIFADELDTADPGIKSRIKHDGTLLFGGVATGSLVDPAVYGGALQYDSTRQCLVGSNGTAWACLARSNAGTAVATWAAGCGLGGTNCAADTNLSGSYSATGAYTNARVTCSWTTAGAVGGGSNAVKVKVRDATGASTLCTCTLGSATCAESSGTPRWCDCAGTYTSGNNYALQFESSGACGTQPGGVICNVEFRP